MPPPVHRRRSRPRERCAAGGGGGDAGEGFAPTSHALRRDAEGGGEPLSFLSSRFPPRPLRTGAVIVGRLQQLLPTPVHRRRARRRARGVGVRQQAVGRGPGRGVRANIARTAPRLRKGGTNSLASSLRISCRGHCGRVPLSRACCRSCCRCQCTSAAAARAVCGSRRRGDRGYCRRVPFSLPGCRSCCRRRCTAVAGSVRQQAAGGTRARGSRRRRMHRAAALKGGWNRSAFSLRGPRRGLSIGQLRHCCFVERMAYMHREGPQLMRCQRRHVAALASTK